MYKILNLIIQDRCDFKDSKEYVVSFEICENVKHPERALREAVNEFTKSGRADAVAAIDGVNGYFNWQDAMSSVPDEIFINHGLKPLKGKSFDLFVNHDEVLCESDDPKLAEIKALILELIVRENESKRYFDNGDNPIAEQLADESADRIKKLTTLMEMKSFEASEIEALSLNEENDGLKDIYEQILGILTE